MREPWRTTAREDHGQQDISRERPALASVPKSSNEPASGFTSLGLTARRADSRSASILSSFIGGLRPSLSSGRALRGPVGLTALASNRQDGAGEGNRTLVCSLGSCRSTIELRPQINDLA